VCLSQARINWEACGRKGIWRKNEGIDGGGSLIGPDGTSSPRWFRKKGRKNGCGGRVRL